MPLSAGTPFTCCNVTASLGGPGELEVPDWGQPGVPQASPGREAKMAQISKIGPNTSVGGESSKKDDQTPRPSPEGKSGITTGRETGSEKHRLGASRGPARTAALSSIVCAVCFGCRHSMNVSHDS